MRCRSESVKRTVVDLSFSFFIAPDSRNRTMGLSLPRSKERQRIDSYSISHRYRPAKYLSERGVAIRMVMYKISDSQKRAPSPIRSSSEQARRGRGSPIWIHDLLCLCTESEMNGRGSSIRPNLALSAISNARQSGFDQRCTTGSPATTRRRTSRREVSILARNKSSGI